MPSELETIIDDQITTLETHRSDAINRNIEKIRAKKNKAIEDFITNAKAEGVTLDDNEIKIIKEHFDKLADIEERQVLRSTEAVYNDGIIRLRVVREKIRNT